MSSYLPKKLLKLSLVCRVPCLVPEQHEGKSHELEVAGRMSILEAALDEGINLPHDCKLGVCLTCPSRIVSGEVDQSEGTLDEAVVEQVGLALS